MNPTPKTPDHRDVKPSDELEAARSRMKTEASRPDLVDEASDESFPASDPPAWTDTAATKDGAQQ